MLRLVFVSAALLGLIACVPQSAIKFGTHEKATWLWTNDADRGEDPYIYRCKEYAGNDVVCIKARITKAQPAAPGAARPAPAPAAPTPSPAAEP